MTKIILLILFSLDFFYSNAQDTLLILEKRNQIFLSTGYSKHIIQDDLISPYIYKGTKAPIWIRYKHFGKKYIHNILIYYDQLDLESKITNRSSYFSHFSKNINGFFGYSVDRKVYSFNEIKTDLFIGGKIESYINYRNHYYTTNDQSTTGEQSTCLGLNFSIIKKYNSKNDLITYSFSLPLLSYVLMSNMYNANVSDQINDVDPDESPMAQIIKNGDIVFIDKLFEIQSELSIYKSLNKFMAVGISHFLQFYSFEKHPDNRRTKYLNNQLLVDIIIKF